MRKSELDLRSGEVDRLVSSLKQELGLDHQTSSAKQEIGLDRQTSSGLSGGVQRYPFATSGRAELIVVIGQYRKIKHLL